MIIATPNKRYKTYTLRRYHNDNVIAKFKTKELSKEEFRLFAYFGSETLNKYIRDNNLQNLKKLRT